MRSTQADDKSLGCGGEISPPHPFTLPLPSQYPVVSAKSARSASALLPSHATGIDTADRQRESSTRIATADRQNESAHAFKTIFSQWSSLLLNIR